MSANVSTKTRFDVFKRDGFRCQYCGAMAPDVLLELDHLHPKSKGGGGDLLNLVTSCKECNRGKGKRPLSDNSALRKQQAQLTELHERRRQIEDLLAFREGLNAIKDIEATKVVGVLEDVWSKALDRDLSPAAVEVIIIPGIKKLVKKFGANAVLDAVETAAAAYLKEGDVDSLDEAWRKLGGICYLSTCSKEEKKIHHVGQLLRKRGMNVPPNLSTVLSSAVVGGFNVEELLFEARHCKSWSSFLSVIRPAVKQAQIKSGIFPTYPLHWEEDDYKPPGTCQDDIIE